MINQVDKKVIELLKSKNPLDIINKINGLKVTFADIGDNLVDTFEYIAKSEDSKNEFNSIIDLFSKENNFDDIYEYYLDNSNSNLFKKSLDEYFSNSFYFDISFFYKTLSLSDSYSNILGGVYSVLSSSLYTKRFLDLDSFSSRVDFITNIYPEFSKLNYSSDKYLVIKFIELSKNINIESLLVGLIIDSNDHFFDKKIEFFKRITIELLKNNDGKDFIINHFAESEKLHTDIVEKFSSEKILTLMKYLRKDIIQYVKNNVNINLNYRENKELNRILLHSSNIDNLNTNDKLDILFSKYKFLSSLGKNKEDNTRIFFKKKVMQLKNTNLIDLVYGVNYIPKELFNLIKYSSDIKIESSNMKLFEDIKKLILFSNDSITISFMKPFLFKYISSHFDKTNDNYYIIKFILSVILADNHREYEKISTFFTNLEAFYKDGVNGIFHRSLQYGWLIIVSILITLIAPFGVFIAGFILLIKESVTKVIGKINPNIKMNLNFQTGTFATSIAAIAAILGGTVGFEDIKSNTYDTFKTAINTITIPTNESLSYIGRGLEANILGIKEFNGEEDEVSNIDYINGTTLTKIRDSENIISDDENFINSPTKLILDKNNTFWDYGIRYAKNCNLDTTDKLIKIEILNSVYDFIEDERSGLSKYISGNYRFSASEIAKRLPAIKYDLEGLKDKICK